MRGRETPTKPSSGKPTSRVTAFCRSLLMGLVVTIPSAGLTAPHPDPASGERRLVLFYTAEVHGTVEPCGCTSDPLGDVSRLAALLEDTRGTGTTVGLVDAGGLLYPEGKISAKERPSADLRAEFLATQFERMRLLGGGLGETDLVGGAAGVRPPRLASNLTGPASLLRRPRVERIGGISIGILGVADPTLGSSGHASGLSSGLAEAGEPSATVKREVDELRRAGAEVVVLLAAADKSTARRLARTSGADVIVVGKRVGGGMPRAEQVGRAFLVAPADELQRVGRLEIVLRQKVPPGATAELVDAGGPDADRIRREEIDQTLGRLRIDLTKWAGQAPGKPGDTTTSDRPDAAFLASKRREQSELEKERARRLAAPWRPPATGNYLVNTLVALRRSLRRDPRVAAAMKRLDQRVAAMNLAHAAPPPPPEDGRAFYVGMTKCTRCHAAAAAFWRNTVHAHAWQTLVEGGKQADYKCVGCHATGFGQVGGSSLGFTRRLESVQCETCHGAGSLHVAGEGNEEPLAIKRDTPETVCVGCHTEQHSDTFQFQAYLRDILGKGHGPQRRESLGAGVTGHQLRSAALAKAKLAGRETGQEDVTVPASN